MAITKTPYWRPKLRLVMTLRLEDYGTPAQQSWPSAQWHSKCTWTNIWAYLAGVVDVKWPCSYKVHCLSDHLHHNIQPPLPRFYILKRQYKISFVLAYSKHCRRAISAQTDTDSASHILHWKQARLLLSLIKKIPYCSGGRRPAKHKFFVHIF